MTPDLEVDADAVRDCASALAGTAATVAGGSAPPPLPQAAPGWQTSGALEGLAAATEHELRTLADGLEAFRRSVLAALADFEAADERAAGRLGSGR